MTDPKPAEQNAQPAPEAPKPKLAPGLFQNFTLGSTLDQGPTGNVMANVKQSPIDYEKRAKESKNESLTAEQLEQMKSKK